MNIGIGFAIPSNMAREVRDQLIKRGKVQRGQLGVVIQPLTQELATGLGIKDVQGVLVADVDPNGAAAGAGIRRGDVIRKIDNEAVSNPNSLRNKIAMTTPGTEVTVTINRDGKDQDIKVKLGEAQTTGARSQGGGEGGRSEGAGKLGIAVQPLTPEIARQLGLRSGTSGLVISDVDPSGPAAEAGIQPGDVIVEANRQPVRSGAGSAESSGEGWPGSAADQPARTYIVHNDHAVADRLAPAGLRESWDGQRLLLLTALIESAILVESTLALVEPPWP